MDLRGKVGSDDGKSNYSKDFKIINNI